MNIYSKTLTVKGKTVLLPVFMPDATQGVIRTLDSIALKEIGIEGIVTNTYHLSINPGSTVLKELGGVHQFYNWDKFIISDSGGFQLFSLISKNPDSGKIDENGISFLQEVNGKKRKKIFTPEKSIQNQFRIGSEILICLDYFSDENPNIKEAEKNVEITIEWAKRCKTEFENIVKSRNLPDNQKPLLFAVIQGGEYPDLRKMCAEELIKIGFDGFGFGGWPLNTDRSLNSKILNLTADLMPDDKPKYALGVGKPDEIIKCVKMGYNIFDCVLPTRDARHGRVYILNPFLNPENIFKGPKVYEYIYITDQRYIRDETPLDEHCDCFACQNYSKAFFNHLFKIEDSLAGRLLTIHNLRTYVRLMEAFRSGV